VGSKANGLLSGWRGQGGVCRDNSCNNSCENIISNKQATRRASFIILAPPCSCSSSSGDKLDLGGHAAPPCNGTTMRLGLRQKITLSAARRRRWSRHQFHLSSPNHVTIPTNRNISAFNETDTETIYYYTYSTYSHNSPFIAARKCKVSRRTSHVLENWCSLGTHKLSVCIFKLLQRSSDSRRLGDYSRYSDAVNWITIIIHQMIIRI